MKLPPDGSRWLVSVRWLACAAVFVATGLAGSTLGIIGQPLPLYLVGVGMVVYNLLFFMQYRWSTGILSAEQSIFLQIVLDLTCLTLLLYWSDLSRNPFLLYYLFHMIIAGMYLRGPTPYWIAAGVSTVVGLILLGEYAGWIAVHPLRFPSTVSGPRVPDGFHLLGVFAALASAIWITVYFTTSIRRYVDRAHAELRQKEKMLGIGQLVAGIGHQIANPLDGMENCLGRIGEAVKDDVRLTEYVHMMQEALTRIERTTKRVQAFAQPRGITLQPTDVHQAVHGTLEVLGTGSRASRGNVKIKTELRNVPPVEGDPYTLQEVLFNLCTNALAAMPQGGTLSIRTLALGSKDEDQMGSVGIEVADTGVGIPRVLLDRIFEPFFTTRADSGGTGLGLGLCRMLILEMGGRIEVRSALGQGTTFTVVLKPSREASSNPCS